MNKPEWWLAFSKNEKILLVFLMGYIILMAGVWFKVVEMFPGPHYPPPWSR